MASSFKLLILNFQSWKSQKTDTFWKVCSPLSYLLNVRLRNVLPSSDKLVYIATSIYL